jgi:hypothetical protein
MAAIRCRSALVFANGNHARAAMLVGCGRYTFWRIIKRDNEMLDARAQAAGWVPPPDVPL